MNPAACWIQLHHVSQPGHSTNEALEAAASSAEELKETKEFSLKKVLKLQKTRLFTGGFESARLRGRLLRCFFYPAGFCESGTRLARDALLRRLR